MSYELPLYRQEKDNTCALACLRMVLAAFGTDVDETELEIQARLEIDGIGIGELERLARLFGLIARAQEANVKQLRELLAEGKLAIAYIDRAVFDLPPRQRAERPLRDARIHTVIPTRVSASLVTYHDPLPPARIIRRSMRLFRSAYERLGNHCVVCSKPGRA
jgi:Peptidase C39 family